jgi:hypothetical protein
MVTLIIAKKIRTFYDNNGNIYEIYKKRNNHIYLTITNKLVYSKIIANNKSEILELFKIKYKDTKFSNNPILAIEQYLY